MQVLEGKGIEIWQSSEECGLLITLLSCSYKQSGLFVISPHEEKMTSQHDKR
jgi:hypothetical protein